MDPVGALHGAEAAGGVLNDIAPVICRGGEFHAEARGAEGKGD